MSTAKFEKLIDLIINEDQEAAEQLFHEIVVEKSREIYESLMDDDMNEDMSGDLMSEIEADEEGDLALEADEDMDDMGDMGDEDMGDMGDEDMDDMGDMGDEDMDDMGDMGDEDMGDMGSEEPATKDDIMNLEDKLDQLLSQFEAEFSDHDEEMETPADDDMEADTDEEGEEEFEPEGDEEDEVMESVQLKQVGGATYNKFGKMGDDGANTKSPVAKKGAMGMAGTPVKFSSNGESVPTSPKAPSNMYSKGETQVKGAGSFKNSPGAKVSEKGESAPKPKSEDPGKSKSPVAESKKVVAKKIVKK